MLLNCCVDHSAPTAQGGFAGVPEILRTAHTLRPEWRYVARASFDHFLGRLTHGVEDADGLSPSVIPVLVAELALPLLVTRQTRKIARVDDSRNFLDQPVHVATVVVWGVLLVVFTARSPTDKISVMSLTGV